MNKFLFNPLISHFCWSILVVVYVIVPYILNFLEIALQRRWEKRRPLMARKFIGNMYILHWKFGSGGHDVH
jgi:hypothetical protein